MLRRINTIRLSKPVQPYKFFTHKATKVILQNQFSTTSNANNSDQKSPVDTNNDSNKASSSTSSSNLQKMSFEDYDDYDATGSNNQPSIPYILFSLSLITIGLGLAGYSFKEIFFPGRFNSSSLFSESFNVVRENDEVKFIIG